VTNQINLRARLVLSDCQWTLQQFSETVSGEPLRVSWVAVVTLLRAVGHVLHEVDAEADADVRHVVEQKHSSCVRTRPLPEIYWQFICRERSNILKQYRFGFARTIEQAPDTTLYLGTGQTIRYQITPTSSTPDGRTDGLAFNYDALSVTGGPLPPQQRPITSLIADGPFKGRSEKDVAEEAIRWWTDYLDEVEALIIKRKSCEIA
jgi:hypothetical protein